MRDLDLRKLFLLLFAVVLIGVGYLAVQDTNTKLTATTEQPQTPVNKAVHNVEKLVQMDPQKPDETKAKQVATNFAQEVLTLRGKSGPDDIGGLEYVTAPLRPQAASLAYDSVYQYYDKAKNQVGAAKLPKVDTVTFLSCSKQDIKSLDTTYKQYDMLLQVTYAKDGAALSDKGKLKVSVACIGNVWQIVKVAM